MTLNRFTLMVCAAGGVAFAALLRPAAPAGGEQDEFSALARRALAQIDGVIAVPGLQDTVEVIRDQWGVPHIYARGTADMFFAQGLVHAQDRLWQMDMYRRTFEGRLAEIMGGEYVQHDRLARLMRYRGPLDEQ
jgi:penicillin G amidase